jgi:flagellar basal-body rod modification protein FlgD
MTAIDPFADVRMPATPQPKARSADDNFGKDTFLKLLVAQLRFQNPMSPADPGDFLAQSAQFTMVERLIAIQEQGKEAAQANSVLASAALINKTVTFSIANGEDPVPNATTQLRIGGNLPQTATPGTKFETTTDVYTTDGQKLPLKLEFTRGAEQTEGALWELKMFSGTQQVGVTQTLTFDANGECTNGNITVPKSALDLIPSSPGPWPSDGITLSFGNATDPGRLHVGSGAGTPTVREQNGSDGLTLTGIVSGVRFTEDGAVLRVGDREIPMGSVLEVHPATV